MYFSPDFRPLRSSAQFFWVCGYGLIAAMHASALCTSTNIALQCENVTGVSQDTNMIAIYLENTTLITGDLDHFHRLRVVHMNQCGGDLTELLQRVSQQLRDLRITFSQDTYSFPQILDYSFPQLVQLCLTGNRLTAVTKDLLKNFEKLEKLSLDGNEISGFEHGAMQNIPLLRILNISQNNLTTLQKRVFQNLKQLRELDLSSNRITTIEEGTFEDLAALVSLNLAYNEIVTLQNGVFLGLEPSKSIHLNNRLLRMDLSNNKIINVEWGALNDIAERLASLDLRENALGTDFHFQHLPMEKGTCEVCQTDCAEPIRAERHRASCASAVPPTVLWRAFAELRMHENPLLLSGNPICSMCSAPFCGACSGTNIVSEKPTAPAAIQWNMACVNNCLPHERRRLFFLEACVKVTADSSMAKATVETKDEMPDVPMGLRAEQSFNDSGLREESTKEETTGRMLMAGASYHFAVILLLFICIFLVALYVYWKCHSRQRKMSSEGENEEYDKLYVYK